MRISVHRGFLAGLLILLALALSGGALAALALGISPRLQLLSTRTVQAASFVHLGLVGWIGGMLTIVLAARLVRRPGLAALALPLALGALWQATWIVPYYTTNTVAHRTPLTVATINVQDGRADLDGLTAQLQTADVIVIVEHTDAARERLADRGLTESHPHAVHVGNGVGGTSIYSRLPLEDLGAGPTVFGSPVVRLDHPDGPLTLIAAHPVNPMGGAELWAEDAAALRAVILAHADGPVVVAGDLNAIDRHATMRPLLTTDGFRSTADLTGAGFPRTWPTREHGPFPVLGIDYVLVNAPLTAVSHRTFTVTGTDHVGIIAQVALRA
ncbi:endonuclease/exonuclease/phosphatase family protein [Ammonicoccus fulvus]|uniref:Endonuclease/exonuclease/phosphatase family protein n=1 Tax=Ammonicoccus fulvus TaxID=3138240 RepID=A0ABZ3FNU2_9ACTN